MSGTVHHVDVGGGGRLEYYVSGPPEGMPLVFHHGTPGGASPVRVAERAAHARGLRFVVLARPGYGGSTRRAGRRVAGVVDATDAVLAALGSRSCVVAGWSGGGPHALACAARLPAVLGVVVVAGVAPSDAGGLDWSAGMGEDNLAEFDAAARGEEALRPLLEGAAAALRTASAAELGDALSSLLSPADLAALPGELGADLEASMRAGIDTSVDGWVDDDLAFLAPWGFALEEIDVPTFLWQGTEDLMVPQSHGRWLAAQLPAATAHLLEDEGHLSILANHAGEMLDEVLGGRSL